MITDDLLDRVSIALCIAGPEGLSAREIKHYAACGTDYAKAAARKLAELGYAKTVHTKFGRRFVLVREYPASEGGGRAAA